MLKVQIHHRCINFKNISQIFVIVKKGKRGGSQSQILIVSIFVCLSRKVTKQRINCFLYSTFSLIDILMKTFLKIILES